MVSKLIIFGAVSVSIYFAIALILTYSESSSPKASEEGLDFSRQIQRGGGDVAKLQSYKASDGQQLDYRHYESQTEDAPLLILIHGSGWHGMAFDHLAKTVASSGKADVVVPDLRGHGASPVRRGDVDYIGQLEDDLQALIAGLKKPNQKVILGGHSSGGGLVVRYAGGRHSNNMDAAILLAPFLKYNAPTTRPDAGGWANPLTRRIIGLTMLNSVGITALNHLPIIEFAFPRSVLDGPLGKTATQNYSYRLNVSFSPRNDYLDDISKLPNFLLIAGKDDEAFMAEKYEPTMSAVNSSGEYVLLERVSHLDVMYDPGTLEHILRFLDGKL